ncbi:hypothetical protein MTO96_010434 [Rhipicephalus appendiculatus]
MQIHEYDVQPLVQKYKPSWNPESAPFAGLHLQLRFSRRLTPPLLATFLPSAFLVCLSWCVFWMRSRHVPERISLTLMLLLALYAQMSAVRQSLPPSNYLTLRGKRGSLSIEKGGVPVGGISEVSYRAVALQSGYARDSWNGVTRLEEIMPGSRAPETTTTDTPLHEPPASGKVASHLQDRCWIIPFVAAGVTFLTTIIESNRGYLYVLFMEAYQADHATASWPGNILLSAGHLSGFVIVFLQSKLSVFVIGLLVVAVSAIAVAGGAFCPDMTCMAVTVGGLYGLGYGASLTTFAIYTMIYFEKYMATATALKYAAWSASGLVGPSIVSLLANYYGLRGTLLLIGAITLNGLPLIMLIRHPRPLKLRCSPSRSKPKPSLSSPSSEHHAKTVQCAKQSSSPSSAAFSPLPKSINRLGLTAKGVATLFRTPEFYVLLFVYALYDWTGTLHSTTCVDYGRDKGASLETAKYVLTCNAFGHIVGRVGLSFAADKIPFSHCPLAAACLVASCLSFVGSSFVSSFTAFMVLNGLLGVSQGYVTCIRSVLISQYLTVQRLPAFFAFLGVFLIPIALTGPSIVGFFRDNLGSYDNIYRLLGAANLLAAVVLCVLACRDGVRRTLGSSMSPATTDGEQPRQGRLLHCELCDYKTERSYNLRVHAMSHTGERPHKCHLCPQSFLQSHNLNKHLRIHMKERPYKCHICSKTFPEMYRLTYHLRTHTALGSSSSPATADVSTSEDTSIDMIHWGLPAVQQLQMVNSHAKDAFSTVTCATIRRSVRTI